MGDPMNPQTTAFLSLPPGCRFHPSEEQLLCYYLTNKNKPPGCGDSDCGCDLIKDVDLYGQEPGDLPGTSCFSYGYGGRRRHWYCYTARAGKRGKKRRAGGGYWKRKGRVRDVVCRRGKAVLGKRKSFVFYSGNSPKSAARTHWFMHEYSLAGHSKASFVLCRVFVKSRSGNNTSEHVLSSCAEESIATVRHIGTQHDGSITSDKGEAKTHYDNCVDKKHEMLRFPMNQSSGLNDQVTAGPVSVADSQHPLGIPPSIAVRSVGHSSGGAGFVDAVASQQLISILQEDFIELDDLVGPLLGLD